MVLQQIDSEVLKMLNASGTEAEGVRASFETTVNETPAPTARKSANGPNYLKLIVHNLVAGSIIGKNGTIIAALENETGSSIKLSPAQCYFPLTQDRVALISGTEKEVETAFLAILNKIQEVHFTAQGMEADLFAKDVYTTAQSRPTSPQSIQVRFAVPKTAISAVIGRSGQNIKSLQQTTGAKVQVSSRDDNLTERVIAITGGYDEVKTAGLALNAIIQQDPTLKTYTHLVYSVKGTAAPGAYPGFPAAQSAASVYNPAFQQPSFGAVRQRDYSSYPTNNYCGTLSAQTDVMNMPCEITISIPDNSVGVVIGKRGSTLVEIMRLTGAKIKISQKGEYVSENTQERKCEIRGTISAVHTAHIMLLQRLELLQIQQPKPATETTTARPGLIYPNGFENCMMPDLTSSSIVHSVTGLPTAVGSIPGVFGLGVTPTPYGTYEPPQL